MSQFSSICSSKRLTWFYMLVYTLPMIWSFPILHHHHHHHHHYSPTKTTFWYHQSKTKQLSFLRSNYYGCSGNRKLLLSSSTSSNDNNSNDNMDNDGTNNNNNNKGIDLSLDPRLYKVRLSRAPGIDWGTDLSFSFVYVRDMDPSGEASLCGEIQKGDQLCELTPIDPSKQQQQQVDPKNSITGGEPVNLLGAPFDFVMNTFVGLDKSVREVDLVFFRGTKKELQAVCTNNDSKGESETITVTVIQNKGSKDETTITLLAKPGVNVRELLVENGINVYQSVTRWTNCKGKQLCGTCIVNVTEGSMGTNRKSMDEASTLRENPDSYRLSCVTFAYDNITVETFPPIKPAQWTR